MPIALTPSMTRATFSLANKIVLLVVFMGTTSIALLQFAASHMQRTEASYHALLERQTNAAVHLSSARQILNEVNSLVQSTQQPSKSRNRPAMPVEQLQRLRKEFKQHWHALYPLLPEQRLALDTVLSQSKSALNIAQHTLAPTPRSITAPAPPTSANGALGRAFQSSNDKLLASVDRLQEQVQHSFVSASQRLMHSTDLTIKRTILLSWFIVLLITGLAAWMAVHHISRPISRLTRNMQRISKGSGDTPAVDDQHRTDEIGAMARALQRFSVSQRKAQQLQQAHALAQRQQLLTEQLTQLTSALPGPLFQFRWDQSQRLELVFISPQWRLLAGISSDSEMSLEAATQTIFENNPHAYANAIKHFAHSAQTLQPLDFDTSLSMLDGATRWIKTSATPIAQADGQVIFNGVWMDFTKEITQSLALEKAKRQAEHSAQEKSTLQASISHEIRTPLNAILGLTQLLLKADLPATQREQLENVLRASRHLHGIVNEVLDFSKLDAGQMQLESTDFSLSDVLHDVLSMCHEEAQKKALHLSHSIHPDIPDSLRGDPHRIAQILLNYVNNAIKFTAHGSIHIQLNLHPSSTLHRIVLHASVKDTGPGIPADRLPLLFQAFQQADNSITRRYGGTGLGLTISRELAHLMGGHAGVESQLGQGSTFWFTALLEPARTNVQPSHTAAPAVPHHPWQGMRALVVDDNALNRAVAQGMLHALGLHTDTAEDGAQALAQLQKCGADYYQCVFMDLQMPHIDGLSATQTIRQWPDFAQLPIIAMTAHSSVEDHKRTQAAGMNDHLCKPLLESALQTVLQTWLGQQRHTAQPISHDQAAAPPDNADTNLPVVFEPSALDDLAALFTPEKLMQLVQQFAKDTTQRTHTLLTMAQQNDWQGMRAETHKLSGTADTFGLLQLGHLSSKLSAALKSADAQQATALAHHIAACAHAGILQLQAYSPGTPKV